MQRYIARDGDTIDSICWEYYGATFGVVEQVIEANPGIEDRPVKLQAGTEILLPDVTMPTSGKSPVRLWD